MNYEIMRATLAIAVPLKIMELKRLDEEQRGLLLEMIENKIMCNSILDKMEYLVHRGEKDAYAKRCFNEIVTAIALLAYSPGGITIFEQSFDASYVR